MTPTAPDATSVDLITGEVLARFDQRAPRYDRDNEFELANVHGNFWDRTVGS